MTSISANQNLPTRQDPNTYAQAYANQNNISLDAAKAKLKELYGDPQEKQQDESIFSDQKTNADNNIMNTSSADAAEAEDTSETGFLSFIRNLFGLSEDSNEEELELDPDVVAQKYADANGLSLDDAKTKLGELYGTPDEMEEDKAEEEDSN